MNPSNFTQQGGMSPATLNFQPKQPQLTLNPSQLLGGGTINPSHLNGAPSGMNTAPLAAHPQPVHMSQQQQQNISNMLAFFGISVEHFRNMSPQERQTMYQRYGAMMNSGTAGGGMGMQNGSALGQSQQQPFERPSSSASTHSQGQNHMMPPPPPRPPTAQGGSTMMGSQISRPGTSLSHRSPTIPGPGLSSLDGQQRPHSRMSQPDGMMNGFKQGQTQQSFAGQTATGLQSTMLANTQNPYPSSNMSTGMNNMNLGMGMNPSSNMHPNMNMGMNSISLNPMSGMPGSPRIGGPQQNVSGGAMGPPGLPRSISGEGMSMAGVSMNMGMGNMSMGNMGMGMGGGMGLNGSPGMQRPQSSMGMSGMSGGMNTSMGMAGNMGSMGGMGMGMNFDSPTRPTASSNPMVGTVNGMPQQPHTPMRQGSLPPQPSTPSHGHQGPSGLMNGPQGGPSQQHGAMRQGSHPPGSGSHPNMPRRQSIPPGGMGSPLVSHAAGPTPTSISGGPSSGLGNLSTSSIQGGPMPTPNLLGGIGSTSNLKTTLNNPVNPNSVPHPNGLMPLPPLPAGININPNTTHIKPIPLLTSLKAIPPLSEEEIEKIKGWMETDKEYEGRLRTMKARMSEGAQKAFAGVIGIGANPAGVSGPAGPGWFERGGSLPGGNPSRYRRIREPFDLRYSAKETRRRLESRRKGKREGLKLPRDIAPADSKKPEILVPIRIEFDVDHHRRLKEAFVWNLNDPVVTPEHLAQSIVEDYQLNDSAHSAIVKSIQEQLSDYQAHTFGIVDDDDSESLLRGHLNSEEEAWWSKWRKMTRGRNPKAESEVQRKKRSGGHVKGARKKRKTARLTKVEEEDIDVVMMMADTEGEDGDGECDDTDAEPPEVDQMWKSLRVEELKIDEDKMHEEMRILIKLDIIIASVKLDDQFEWDLDNPLASPEQFAEVYVQELGLNGEFKTAIAHSIREQVQTFQKSLFLIGHPSDGSAVQDEEIKQSFLPSLTSVARPISEVSLFTPLLNYLSDGELDRTEKERDKDMQKRRKRNNRGRRGIALPDREPIRTYRTPAIGFPELDASTLASVQSTSVPTRRAAAAAASLTIANMVAIENKSEDQHDLSFEPQPIQAVPSRPTPPVQALPMAEKKDKNKKDKGLFKAPPYPQTVLNVRATANPTPSTGMDASNLPAGLYEREPLESSSMNGNALLDLKASRILTAKRAKELEREAKEKEFVDGQHPNYINGVWHCSNCGCPDSIAIGRRKGPLGDKSQCGTCGKFWHRHRRPRPVEYNPDPAFHSGAKQKEADTLKTPGNKKKGAAAALRAQQAAAAAAAATPTSTNAADVSEPHTPAPSSKANGEFEFGRRSPSEVLKDDDDRPISPVSTASSASEAPLAHKVKVNGTHSKSSGTPAPPSSGEIAASSTPSRPEASRATSLTDAPASTPAPSTNGAAVVSATRQHPPPWLSNQMQLMQTRYPHDRFDIILRRVNPGATPEWRIKCLDCPGKLYTPGPQETLTNYEVHLRNRQHRLRVNERLASSAS